jgi:hypothetical protein
MWDFKRCPSPQRNGLAARHNPIYNVTLARNVMPRLLTIVGLSCLSGVLHAATDPPYTYQADVRPILEARCIKCHGPKKQKGEIRLDTLATDFIKNRAAAETWHDASNMLKRGEMPPEDERELSTEQRSILISWIDGSLRLAIAAGATFSQGVVMRRLNRTEYQHTMTDLLGLEMNYAEELPSDAFSADGFRNNGAALGMSALQIENYFKTARRAMDVVLVSGEQPVRRVTKLELPREAGRFMSIRSKKLVGERTNRMGRANYWHAEILEFPRVGPFTIRVKAHSEHKPGPPEPILLGRYGFTSHSLSINIMQDLESIAIPSTESRIYELTGRAELFPMFELRSQDLPPLRTKGKIASTTGLTHHGVLTLQNGLVDGNPIPETKVEVIKEEKNGKIRTRKRKWIPEDPDFPKIIVESVEFVAHDYPSWPPPLHRRIIPEGEDLASAESVERILRTFLRRAWRRPPAAPELKRWTGHYQTMRDQTDSDLAALKETLAAALTSANFLYLVEPSSKEKTGSRALTAHELASRLSYFLWSSMPDEELSSLADSGKLLEPTELRKQFARMLADGKSDRFANHFSSQWLDLEGVYRVAINPQYYKTFDNSLKPDMAQETRAFFREILRTNTSALQFIDADFTMVNAALAKHYGLTGPKSQRFERVSLAGSTRPGGLLGHASTHLSRSNGVDSSPVARAVWIRDRLLHDPPSPPPPDVPDLDSNAGAPDFAKLTLLEKLALHRKKAACADCHDSIDPWGIALERYDAIGLWREKTARGGKPVSTKTVLPGNHPIDGVADLQNHLLTDRRDQFAHALASKLLIYALGRTLDLGDEILLEDMSQKFAENDYRLPSLMEDIVTSKAFLSR